MHRINSQFASLGLPESYSVNSMLSMYLSEQLADNFPSNEIQLKTFANGCAIINLNMPKQMNSLTFSMIIALKKTFLDILHNSAIKFVILTGEGRHFCSGGNLRNFIYPRQGPNHRFHFIYHEYTLDYALHQYPKPIICLMTGAVMGGGLGLAMGCDFRILAETAIIAMPEVQIGHFPDVGGSFFLPRIAHGLGMFLGITGYRCNAQEALFAGFGTHLVPENKLPEFVHQITSLIFDLNERSTARQIEDLLQEFSVIPSHNSFLSAHSNEIQRIFTYKVNFATLLQNLISLSNSGNESAIVAMQHINRACPLSLHITHRMLRTSVFENMNRAECLRLELCIASKLILKSRNDREGLIRALENPDYIPRWEPGSLEAFPVGDISKFFHIEYVDAKCTENIKNLFRSCKL